MLSLTKLLKGKFCLLGYWVIAANGTDVAFIIQIFCVNIRCLEVWCHQCKVNLLLFKLILYDAFVNRQHHHFNFRRLDFRKPA